MKKVEKAICWICKEEYDTVTVAKKCEAKGLMTPHFKIGDVLKYQVCLGSDRDGPHYKDRTGVVLDILFSVPPNYYKIGYALLHSYQVSYLVNVEKYENETGDRFFEKENIQLLQTIMTTDVTREASCFFGDDSYINGTQRSRHTIVTSWADYTANVVRRNPQLKNRLVALTTNFRKLNCIDI